MKIRRQDKKLLKLIRSQLKFGVVVHRLLVNGLGVRRRLYTKIYQADLRLVNRIDVKNSVLNLFNEKCGDSVSYDFLARGTKSGAYDYATLHYAVSLIRGGTLPALSQDAVLTLVNLQIFIIDKFTELETVVCAIKEKCTDIRGHRKLNGIIEDFRGHVNAITGVNAHLLLPQEGHYA